jgi:hypothetical protein
MIALLRREPVSGISFVPGRRGLGEGSVTKKTKAGFDSGLAYMKSGLARIRLTAADHGSGHRVAYAYMPPYRD